MYKQFHCTIFPFLVLLHLYFRKASPNNDYRVSTLPTYFCIDIKAYDKRAINSVNGKILRQLVLPYTPIRKRSHLFATYNMILWALILAWPLLAHAKHTNGKFRTKLKVFHSG